MNALRYVLAGLCFLVTLVGLQRQRPEYIASVGLLRHYLYTLACLAGGLGAIALRSFWPFLVLLAAAAVGLVLPSPGNRRQSPAAHMGPCRACGREYSMAGTFHAQILSRARSIQEMLALHGALCGDHASQLIDSWVRQGKVAQGDVDATYGIAVQASMLKMSEQLSWDEALVNARNMAASLAARSGA